MRREIKSVLTFIILGENLINLNGNPKDSQDKTNANFCIHVAASNTQKMKSYDRSPGKAGGTGKYVGIMHCIIKSGHIFLPAGQFFIFEHKFTDIQFL